MNEQELDILIKGGGDRAALEKALAPVLAARAKLADLEVRVDEKQKDIDRVETDSKRLHDNLVGLKDSPEERTLARRYAGEMNTDEDQLQTLRKDRADLEQQQKAAQQALDDAIASLNLDEDV
jgi:predicted  nucleic acid-binding Zn-ribbon protein